MCGLLEVCKGIDRMTEVPRGEDRARRLGSVLEAIYLMFNEGYTRSGGPELQRVDLSDEAMRVARTLPQTTVPSGLYLTSPPLP